MTSDAGNVPQVLWYQHHAIFKYVLGIFTPACMSCRYISVIYVYYRYEFLLWLMSGKVKLEKLRRVKRGVDLDVLSVIVLNLLSLQV